MPGAICAILHVACGTFSTEKPRSSLESFAPSDEGAARVLDWDGTVVSVGPREPGVPGQATAVRWSLLGDAIDFHNSFNLSFEYGANAPATAIDYSSVAFYYAD